MFIRSALGAASFTIYSGTKDYCRDHNYLSRDSIIDASLVGGISGAMSGALISFGSARQYPYLPSPVHCLIPQQHLSWSRSDDSWNIPSLPAKAFI
jgi:hypothetical protein